MRRILTLFGRGSVRNKTTKTLVMMLAFMLTGLVSCGLSGSMQAVEKTDYLMSTSVNVKIFFRDRALGEDILRRAFAEAFRVETIMEPQKGNGELKRINEGGSGVWWNISPELRTVLERAGYFYQVSGGAFDPTIAAVKWIWDFEDGGHVPSDVELAQAMETVGFEHLELRGDSLMIDHPGTRIDLGGIAKGYIVDRMVGFLRDEGVAAGLINAGGDIYSFGTKPDGSHWVIGLRHPRNDEMMVLAPTEFPAVATSGDYERFFIHDGVRYHHILDPKTGHPATGAISVTIWTCSAMDADALATTVFVLGHEEGLALANRLDEVETLIYYEDNGDVRYVTTPAVEGIISR